MQNTSDLNHRGILIGFTVLVNSTGNKNQPIFHLLAILSINKRQNVLMTHLQRKIFSIGNTEKFKNIKTY